MRPLLICALGAALLGGCASQPPKPKSSLPTQIPDSENIETVKSAVLNPVRVKSGAVVKDAEKRNIRLRALRETAYTVAYQAGTRARQKQINRMTEANADQLDITFDFHRLLVDGKRLLPPVLVRADQSEKLTSDTELWTVSTAFRILRPARLVSAVPTWRDYLQHDYAAVDEIPGVLHPANADEQAVWKDAASKGWKAGFAQADILYQDNLDRLLRDYRGMMRFHTLAGQKIISLPRLATGRYGIQVGDKVLDVNQTVFQITQPSTFQASDQWTPNIVIQTNP